MKALEISSESWHYKVSQWFDYYDATDMCGYVWRVLWNLLRASYFTVGCIILILLALIPFAIAIALTVGMTIPAPLAVIGIAVGLVELGIAGAFIKEKYHDYQEEKWNRENTTGVSYWTHLTMQKQAKEDARRAKGEGFFRMAWKTLKQKTCYRLEVK